MVKKVKGKKVAWKLQLHATGKKNLGGQKTHGHVNIAKSQAEFEETGQQQQFQFIGFLFSVCFQTDLSQTQYFPSISGISEVPLILFS